MILVIGSEKGGCGKSTLAINLVVMSAREGIDTLLVDADIQGSCNEFSQRRDELAIAPRIQVMLDGSTIVLRGKVGDDDERRLAENVLRLTPGVRDIRNELALDGSTSTASSQAP